MIDRLSGKIIDVKERSISLDCHGVGFALHVPQAGDFIVGVQAAFFVYFNWSAEQGPSLYGFSNEKDRALFLLIIDCPKIGPSLAMNLLAQRSSAELIEMIMQQNHSGLSTINGIGPKKAEYLIVQIKDKVYKLAQQYPQEAGKKGSIEHWQNVREVLTSLNYSKQEVSQAISFLGQKHSDQSASLDQLIRGALAYLSSLQQ